MEQVRPQCCEKVWQRESGSFWGGRSAQCKRASVVDRDGKPYCKMHDPIARKEKDDAAYTRKQSALASFDVAKQLAVAVLTYNRVPYDVRWGGVEDLAREFQRLAGEQPAPETPREGIESKGESR